MKTIGIELCDFACFDSQFVPIRPGITLLVGRNNAGKTAILRGMSALQALPIGLSPKGTPVNLGGYFRENQRSFELHVLSSIDESVGKCFPKMPNHWLSHMHEAGVARWRFTALPNAQLRFMRCTLQIPDMSSTKEIDVIVTNRNSISLGTFNSEFVAGAWTQLTNRTFDDNLPIFDTGHPITAALEEFPYIKLISPHRVVADNQMLQTATELPGGGETLAQFLNTLMGRDRDAFEAIEKFVTRVFPEVKHVNPEPQPNNQVSLVLTMKSGQRIPLANCGTGIEQVLTLATFVLTTRKPGLVLMDEPHSYLHPVAERALVDFLLENPDHRYVISTHSAVLMNSIEPDRILYVSPPGKPYGTKRESPEISKILFELGYRNSDLLFHDRLIIVEGKSDREILPILLQADGQYVDDLRRTGFPILEGAPKGSTAIQTSILKYERLLNAVGRADQPHMYIVDGDRSNDDQRTIKDTKHPNTLGTLQVAILPRLEIENYLLIPEAICDALRDELKLGGTTANVETSAIDEALKRLLNSDEPRLFPYGRKPTIDPAVQVKGSRVLEEIYEMFGLRYHKERSGTLIARHITGKNQPNLGELAALVKPVF